MRGCNPKNVLRPISSDCAALLSPRHEQTLSSARGNSSPPPSSLSPLRTDYAVVAANGPARPFRLHLFLRCLHCRLLSSGFLPGRRRPLRCCRLRCCSFGTLERPTSFGCGDDGLPSSPGQLSLRLSRCQLSWQWPLRLASDVGPSRLLGFLHASSSRY